MASTAPRMAADEYYALTVAGDRKQLVAGEIVVNDPKPIHAQLQGRFYRALMHWVVAARGEAFLPTDIRLDEYNIYGPDPERVPNLCVEIRSPGAWRYDIGAKRTTYERSGLPELWLVDDRSNLGRPWGRSHRWPDHHFAASPADRRGALPAKPRSTRWDRGDHGFAGSSCAETAGGFGAQRKPGRLPPGARRAPSPLAEQAG